MEYNIPEALGPNTNHTKSREVAIDEICPQTEDLEIVRFILPFNFCKIMERMIEVQPSVAATSSVAFNA